MLNRIVLIAMALLLVIEPCSARVSTLTGIGFDTGTTYSISTANASATQTGTINLPLFGDAAYDNSGTLYGFTCGGAPSLYRFNSSLQPTLVGQINVSFIFEGAIAFATNGTAYVMDGGDSSEAQLLTVNTTTAAATVVGTLAGGLHDINGMIFRSDGKLVALDDSTNSLELIDPSNATFTTLATLPFTVGSCGGVTSAGGVDYFATSTSGTNSLYTFDPFTGVSTLVGAFPSTVDGDGLGAIFQSPVVPEPSSLAIVFGAGAVLTSRRRPSAGH